MRVLSYITTAIVFGFMLVSVVGLFVMGTPDPADIQWVRPNGEAIVIALAVYNYPLMIQICI